MSVYADEIEEASDHSIRRARVNALFEGTRMAALVAAAHDEIGQEEALTDGEIVRLVRRNAA